MDETNLRNDLGATPPGRKNHSYKQLKNFQKKIRVGLTLCFFIKKEAQTRVSRIGNSVHYIDYTQMSTAMMLMTMTIQN